MKNLKGAVAVITGASSGIVEGTARVLFSAAEMGELLPGEILVVHTTDVGWTPLFCIAALMYVPAHLSSALSRLEASASRLLAWVRQPWMRKATGVALLATAALCTIAAFTRNKEHAFTMEVPRDRFPVAAVEFIQTHHLQGRMLAYFDWGEMCLWELPDCPVSIDGRLDTAYPHDVISAHWQLYRGEAVDPAVLNIDMADLALLPHLPGTERLVTQLGWKVAYADPLAAVLVRDPARFPNLGKLTLPVLQGPEATTGRAPFPGNL